jgi:putative endonuclease
MGPRRYYVYILASHIGGTLYIGVTNNDVVRRVAEHKLKIAESFTKRHEVTRLVYFEIDQIEQAIHREKRLKKWPRTWKISLIEKDNPNWVDLYPEIAGS